MKNRNLKGLIVMAMCLGVLSGCGQVTSNDSQSTFDLLQKSTIYYSGTEKEAVNTLNNTGLFIDMNDDEQKDFIKYNTNISIKDSGDLTIQVNNAEYSMSIWSKHEGHTQTLYNLINEVLTKEKTKYMTLYSHLMTDGDGNIKNIRYDMSADQIIIDFTKFEEVDTRFIDLYYEVYNEYVDKTLADKDGNFELVKSDDADYENTYVVTKNDAIYGIAINEKGMNVLSEIDKITDNKFIKLQSNNIYKGTSIEETVETVNSSLEYNRLEKFNINQIEPKSELTELRVFIRDDAVKFKDDIVYLLKCAGYEYTEATNSRTSDLIIGYTWMYNNSLQSTLDDTLAKRLIGYHNMSGYEDARTDFILKSSWELRVVDNEKE